jgi:hypothetical protein
MVRWRREDRTGSAVSSTRTHWLDEVTVEVFDGLPCVLRRDPPIEPGCVPKYHREVTPVQTSHEEVAAATAVTGRTMRPQTVPVNVYEAPEALIVVAPFPAVHPTT